MSLAAIKRKLQIGQQLQIVRHDYGVNGKPSEKIAGIRQIIKVQTNAVQFSGGSWFYFPSAIAIRETTKGFQVDLQGQGKFDKIMEYEWRD